MTSSACRGTVAAVALVVAALAAPQAAAASTASVSPNVAGKGSHVTLDFLFGQGHGGQNPQSVVVRVVRGFKFDPQAVAGRCKPSQASANNCPDKSRIGGGTAYVTASSALLPPQHRTAAVDLYLAPKPNPGDIAGIVAHFKEPTSGQEGSISGRVVPEVGGVYGIDTRFDAVAGSFTPPQGFTIHLDRLTASFGAKRTVKKKYKKNGKTKTKKVRHNLVKNPKTCPGSWPYEIDVAYSDGTSPTTGSVPCTAH